MCYETVSYKNERGFKLGIYKLYLQKIKKDCMDSINDSKTPTSLRVS